MNKHTPGEWIAKRDAECGSDDQEWGVMCGEYWIATTLKSGADGVGGCEIANARLMAAAPDLLDALQKAFLYINGGPGYTPENRMAAYHAARAAIAKATGEQA